MMQSCLDWTEHQSPHHGDSAPKGPGGAWHNARPRPLEEHVSKHGIRVFGPHPLFAMLWVSQKRKEKNVMHAATLDNS